MISMKNLESNLIMIKKRFDSTDKLKINFSNKLKGEFDKNILTIFLK